MFAMSSGSPTVADSTFTPVLFVIPPTTKPLRKQHDYSCDAGNGPARQHKAVRVLHGPRNRDGTKQQPTNCRNDSPGPPAHFTGPGSLSGTDSLKRQGMATRAPTRFLTMPRFLRRPDPASAGPDPGSSPVVRFVMSAILSSPQRSAVDHQITPDTQNS